MEFCDKCPKSYHSKSDLVQHMFEAHRVGDSFPHMYISRFQCDRCRKSFWPEHNLLRHKESKIHDLEDFLDNFKPNDIMRYIDLLQMGPAYFSGCLDVVADVELFFYRSPFSTFTFKINRTIRGGSLATGTAIKLEADIDLVIFISELPSVDSPKYNMQLQGYLKQVEDTIITAKKSHDAFLWNVEVVGRNDFALKLRVKSKSKKHAPHEVRLHLAKDLLEPTPINCHNPHQEGWAAPGKKEEVYTMMDTLSPSARENCSAALVELQRDFVKKQSRMVKKLIQMVKKWKKSYVDAPSLTSYLLELLCIHISPSLPFHPYICTAAAFKTVLEKLRDYNSICAYWTDNYSYSRVVAMFGKRPLILDPANPYNNVADRCKDWARVARAARDTLRKPFFTRYNHPEPSMWHRMQCTCVHLSSDLNDFLRSHWPLPCDVHNYISQRLQPDNTFREECSSVVDRLADFFKRSSLFTVNRFIKGGSLGKGTAIITKSDIDLVMLIAELPPIDSPYYYHHLQHYLEQMERALQRSKESIAYNLEVLGRTSHAVKLRVKTQKRDHESHDVDLLLATDLLGPVPTSATKAEVYAMMGRMDARSRENCSAALVELQRDFVKKQPAEVKDLIRLVKMWNKTYVTEKSLTSYPLELLCIHTWGSDMTVAAAFKAVLLKLYDYRSIYVCWTDNYSTAWKEILDKRPLILDPANPYNNVADRCRDWDAVARAAQQTLQKPFFSFGESPSTFWHLPCHQCK